MHYIENVESEERSSLFFDIVATMVVLAAGLMGVVVRVQIPSHAAYAV